MSNQPEPLRLAHEDEQMSAVLRMQPKYAPELRRLHAANVGLIDALQTLVDIVGLTAIKYPGQKAVLQEAMSMAANALSKHGGQQCANSSNT